jgi:hypothetical protein
VKSLFIHWLSGEEQELKDLTVDRRVFVGQGQSGPAAIETLFPSRTFRP